MVKPWLKHYPAGLAHEIDTTRFASIPAVVAEAVGKFGPKPAFTSEGATISFNEVGQRAKAFAAYLQSLGLQKGDRIALQMPNMLAYPVALFGALQAGLIVVNTNPLYTPREMAHQFNDSGAKAIVIVANFAHLLEQVLPETPQLKHVIVAEIGDGMPFLKRLLVNLVIRHVKKMVPPYHLPQAVAFQAAVNQGASLPFQAPSIEAEDLAFLQYTGGTTGVSKGAMLTHRNVIANMLQIFVWMSPKLKEGQETVLTPLPLYHIFSLTVNCLAIMSYGGRNILVANPRDLPKLVATWKQYRPTIVTGVNTLFNGLMQREDFRALDFSYLKGTVGGAMAVQKAVAERWLQVTGQPLLEGYGLTESSPVVACNPLGGGERLSSIGLPVPSTDVILRDEDGNEVPQGEPGELCVAGPQVMRGYWERPDETAKVIKNGYLHTGDVAIMDADGYFKIVDRMKDMILVSGFNVYPNEVEDVLAAHPKVLEVAVVGVVDERCGEAVKAFVVKRDESLTEAELIAFSRESLTAYKVPRQVEFRTELPKTNVGKILRRALREPAAT